MTKASRMFRKQNHNLAILTPLDVEKWSDFSSRMFSAPTTPLSCQNDHRVTRSILSRMPGIDVKGTIASFEKLGGYCDCEVIMNAMRHLEREYNGTRFDVYFTKVLGEKFDPHSPKWKALVGPMECLCNDCHEKLEAEKRTAKKLTDGPSNT